MRARIATSRVAKPTQCSRLYPPVAWGCGAKSPLNAAVASFGGRGVAWPYRMPNSTLGGQAVFRSSRHRSSSRYHVFFVLAFAIALMAVAGSRAAEPDVRIADPSLKGCTVKGVVQAKVTAPQFPTFGFLTGDAPPLFGILKTDAVAELKQKAAAVGANRIVLRHATSSGTRTYHPRAGRSAEWEATILTADAYRC